MYFAVKQINYLYELQKQEQKLPPGELCFPISGPVQINFIFPDNIRILCSYYNLMLSTNCKNYTQNGKNIRHFSLISYRVCTPSSIFDQQHEYLLRSIMQDCLSSCLGHFGFIVLNLFKENYLTFQIFSFNTLSISYEGYLRCLLLGREAVFCC